MNIAIIDYRSGNLHSALKSFQAVASNFKNANVKITSCYKDVQAADKVVLPGVGSFSFCKSKLHENTDVYNSLIDMVIEKKKPFLGICVGMQLLATTGNEGQSNNQGLDWICGEVKKIDVEQNFKIPHMGWNYVEKTSSNSLFNLDNQRYYFAHSYYANLDNKENISYQTEYINKFPSIVENNNIIGFQFHPEKSHNFGKQILNQFVNL